MTASLLVVVLVILAANRLTAFVALTLTLAGAAFVATLVVNRLDAEPKTIATVLDAAFTDEGSRIDLAAPSLDDEDLDLASSERELLRTLPFRDALIRMEPATTASNCHGWVFTGGRYPLRGGDVFLILRENDYTPVDSPRPGDLVLYRDGECICHTAVVREVGPGRLVIVEGKWGNLSVFRHAVDHSIFGTDVVYFRTSRGSHLLRGVIGREDLFRGLPLRHGGPTAVPTPRGAAS